MRKDLYYHQCDFCHERSVDNLDLKFYSSPSNVFCENCYEHVEYLALKEWEKRVYEIED